MEYCTFNDYGSKTQWTYVKRHLLFFYTWIFCLDAAVSSGIYFINNQPKFQCLMSPPSLAIKLYWQLPLNKYLCWNFLKNDGFLFPSSPICWHQFCVTPWANTTLHHSDKVQRESLETLKANWQKVS